MHGRVPGISPGSWLRRQREAAGLTQEELAERSGVSVRTIANLEQGRTHRPFPSSVRALVRALGLPKDTSASLLSRYRSGGAAAAQPAAVIRAFLGSLLAGSERIPRDREAQAGLYRSLLAGKRMLVMLDNARDSAQVSPLLPGTPGCVVIVTSRSQLTGLVAASDAHPVTLGVLDEPQARRLLARRIGDRRVAAEREGTDDIARLCAYLPLALCITAARAVTCPDLPLAALAAELRDARHRLDVLDLDDSASVRAAFSWSYGNLRPAEARVFRLLSVHPGAEISPRAAASVSGIPLAAARAALRRLVHSNLLTEIPPDRYAFHDLLRAAKVRCGQARELFRELGNSLGEAAAWDTLGQIHASGGESAAAIDCFQRAVQQQRDIGNRYSVATTLAHLADALFAAGNPPGARDAWKEALAILGEMRHPDAAEIARKLRDLGA